MNEDKIIGPIIEGLSRKHYAFDEERKTAVMKRLKEMLPEFHLAGIHASKVEHWYWEKW